MRRDFSRRRRGGALASGATWLLATCFAAHTAAASDWPGFRGPHGNGRLDAGLPAGDGELRLVLRWRRPIGSGYSGFAVAAGLAVTATSDEEHDLVLAFDPESGAERWSYALDAKTIGAGGSKDGPISTPAIADGRVFLVGTQGRLVALDLDTGALDWSVHLVEDLGSTRPLYGFSTSPVVVDDLVVVQAGGELGALVALEASSGAERWRAFADGHYAQSPIVAELAGRRQLVAIGSTRVAGLDPRDGRELWSHRHEGAGEFGADSSSPLPVGGDRLFVKHDNERSSVLEIVVRDDESLDVEVVAESRSMTRSYSPPTVWGEQVYGYTSRFLSALDLGSGDEIWRSRAPGDGFLIAVEGHLFVVSKNEGSVHLGTASPEGWTELDRLDLFDDLVWTPPIFAHGAFYVRSLTEMARVDVVRRAIQTTDHETGSLPPELERLRERIGRGEAEAEAAVDELLRDLDGPLVDGERVLFLHRSDAEEVGLAGDMFGFRYDEPMRRLEGTDLWWWQTELDRRGRFSYVYFPDYRPSLDPLNPRTVEATVMGPDLNHRDEAVLDMSWFAMPDWPGHRETLPPTTQPEAVAPEPGRLEQFEVEVVLPAGGPGPRGNAAASTVTVTVPVTVWLPPGYEQGSERYPTVYSLERYAVPIGDWPGSLDDTVVSGRIAPLIGVMIDAPDGFYGRRGGGRVGLLVPGIVEAVDGRYRTLAEPEQRAVVGALYTGPPALALAIGEERLFARVAVQSPFALDVTLPMHRQQIARASSSPRPLAFYFEWAHWEMRSRGEGIRVGDSMQDLYELFLAAGYQVVGGEVWDSTDWAGWRNRTGVILEALFSPVTGAVPAGLAPWLVRSR